MASIIINLDTQPIKVASESISEQVGRLAGLLEGLPLDHPARLFELPLGDLWEAIGHAEMLADIVKGDALQLVPHPVLVHFGGLVGAICDGIEAKLKAEAVQS
jgi:hypothetical protein